MSDANKYAVEWITNNKKKFKKKSLISFIKTMALRYGRWEYMQMLNERAALRQMRRTFREVNNPFLVQDTLFHKNFRVSKRLALRLIEEVRPFLPTTGNISTIPSHIIVLMALKFYATGWYFSIILERIFF